MIRSSSCRRDRARAAQLGRPRRVAIADQRAAQLRERAHRVGVLGARVPVAEVVTEVESQPLGQLGRLGDRLRILGETRSISCRRGEHVAEVPAPQRLRGIERRVRAHRHERVLQRRPRADVRVHVAGRHARHLEPPRQPRQPPVAGAVVATGTAAAARPAAGRGRMPPATAAASARRARRAARSRSGRPAPPACSSTVSSATDGSDGGAPGRPSRVCACARVRSRQRFDQPRPSATSSVRWRPSSRSSSAPWIGRSPSARAETANSIEPETEL